MKGMKYQGGIHMGNRVERPKRKAWYAKGRWLC